MCLIPSEMRKLHASYNTIRCDTVRYTFISPVAVLVRFQCKPPAPLFPGDINLSEEFGCYSLSKPSKGITSITLTTAAITRIMALRVTTLSAEAARSTTSLIAF